MLPIIYDIPTLDGFKQILKSNPGIVIIKFGATWCGPCKHIEQDVLNLFNIMPDNVQCVIVDIDISFDLYTFLRKNRVLNGVPVIISYNKGNVSFIPDDYVVGASKDKIEAFSMRCFRLAKSLEGTSVKLPMIKQGINKNNDTPV